MYAIPRTIADIVWHATKMLQIEKKKKGYPTIDKKSFETFCNSL